MSRRTAREHTFKLLYQFDIQKGDLDNVMETFFDENEVEENDRTYIEEIVRGAAENFDQINQVIESNAIGWKMNRISKVNMAILRLAVYEMLYREDIPGSVSINEAVELAKTYDTTESGAFINGVLGAVSKSLAAGQES